MFGLGRGKHKSSLHRLTSIPTGHCNRDALPDGMLPAYDALLDAVLCFRRTVVVRDPDSTAYDSIRLIWMCLMTDNPAVFWVHNRYSVGRRGGSTVIGITYAYEPENAEAVAGMLLSEIDRISAMLPGRSDPVNSALAVHDYLCGFISYSDTQDQRAHTVVGSLLYRNAVCDGTSYAVALILGNAGVECGVFLGKIRDDTDGWHAWNYVVINGRKAHMDVTNDAQHIHGHISHRFFLMDEEDAHKVLSWMGSVGPACGVDYYALAGTRAGSEEELRQLFGSLMSRGIWETEVRVDPGMTVDGILDVLNDLCLSEGRPRVSYGYDDKLNVFAFKIREPEAGGQAS